MTLATFQQALKNKAAQDLDAALQELQESLRPTSPRDGDVLQLQSQLSRLRHQMLIGVISRREADQPLNDLLDRFLKMVELLEIREVRTSVLPQNEHSESAAPTPPPPTPDPDSPLERLEREGRARRAALLTQKLLKLQEALDLATDASVQFKLEHEIGQLQEELGKLRG